MPAQDAQAGEEAKKSNSSKWTKSQILTAISLSLINFTTQISFAVIAPFFSVEAERKGATSTEIGFIFGAFQLVIFITSPIYGRYVSLSVCLSVCLLAAAVFLAP